MHKSTLLVLGRTAMSNSKLTKEDLKFFGCDDLERLEEVNEPKRGLGWARIVERCWMPGAIIAAVIAAALVVQSADRYTAHRAAWHVSGR